MATSNQINKFINTIGPIIQKIALSKGYKYPSAIIAQACLESSYGTSSLASKYYNYFGLKCGSSWKGKSVNLATKEEYTAGTVTNITANFRVYNNMESGVNGYFDFINYSRYSNLKNATGYKDYITKLVGDGYCTDTKYINKISAIVSSYNLTTYDKVTVAKPTLRKGSKGEQVKILQSNLNLLGFLGSNKKKLTEDGDFGDNTVHSLKSFQTKYSLTIDGIYGKNSYNKINSLLN